MRPAVTAMLPPESGRAVETFSEVTKQHTITPNLDLNIQNSEVTTQCICINDLSEMQDKKQSEDN